MKGCLTLLLTACFLVSVAGKYIPVIIEESGADYVEKYSTVVHFFLIVTNNGAHNVKVTVTPTQCCLIIAEEDIDCDIMELKQAPVNFTLGPGNNNLGDYQGRAVFMFRNLYARYRQGNCSFEIITGENVHFYHTLNFDTTPEDGNECFGVDQDPDRDCAPVDCAIKYKGHRNFYRNSTGKCEQVVHCDTRGPDGVEIVAYYDWDNNACHRLDFEENIFTVIESNPQIPVDIDPSQSEYFPNLESERFNNIVEGGDEVIECNHGIQNGIYCECDDGWMSSGIHEADPHTFHWCDYEIMDISGIQYEPVKLPKPLEVFVVLILTMLNIGLTLLWLYIAYIVFLRERCRHVCTKYKEPPYTLLEPN